MAKPEGTLDRARVRTWKSSIPAKKARPRSKRTARQQMAQARFAADSGWEHTALSGPRGGNQTSATLNPLLLSSARIEKAGGLETMRAGLASQQCRVPEPTGHSDALGSRTNSRVGCPLYVARPNSRYPHFTATRIDIRFSGAMMQAVRADWK